MADCPLLSKCIFFNDKMANMPSVAEKIKERMCQGDNANCARFMVFSALGRERVPSDLFPRNVDRAKELIATG